MRNKLRDFASIPMSWLFHCSTLGGTGPLSTFNRLLRPRTFRSDSFGLCIMKISRNSNLQSIRPDDCSISSDTRVGAGLVDTRAPFVMHPDLESMYQTRTQTLCKIQPHFWLVFNRAVASCRSIRLPQADEPSFGFLSAQGYKLCIRSQGRD